MLDHDFNMIILFILNSQNLIILIVSKVNLINKLNMKNIQWLFRFRQDLRLIDNTWFVQMYKDLGPNFAGLFIFDTTILDSFLPKDKRINFLLESLKSLELQLNNLWIDLILEYWKPLDSLKNLIKSKNIKIVYTNQSYWPYWKMRDKEIGWYCESVDVQFSMFDDYLLVKPEQVDFKKVFTPYYRHWDRVNKSNVDNFEFIKIWELDSSRWKQNQTIQKQIFDKYAWESTNWTPAPPKDFFQDFDYSNYDNTRNLPYLLWSSRISPYLSFGQLSIRQIYHYVKSLDLDEDTYIKELAWRDFWHHIHYYAPATFQLEFQEKKRKLKWSYDSDSFKAWQDWMTGFPLVDAGMRQLKAENWMHNRVRMVVASFLCKDLLIDWRLWEAHFRNYLLDYDSNVNFGNWQWCAWVWADPKPLRIFNPSLQAQRFDPECEYIKKYIPELKNVDKKSILNPELHELPYAKPIVIHKLQTEKFKEIYYN